MARRLMAHSGKRALCYPFVLALGVSILMTGVGSVASAEPLSSADGDVPVTRIADESSQPGSVGHVFLSKTYSVPLKPASLVLTGDPTTTAPVVVDDEITIRIANLRSSRTHVWTHDFSRGCTSPQIAPLGVNELPDLTRYLASDGGGNSIEIQLRDKCGTSQGSGPLYLAGAHLTQTAGDRTDRLEDLYEPGREDDPGLDYSDCGALYPSQGAVEFAGPLVIDGSVHTNARINTVGYCTKVSGSQILSVADCESCSYREISRGPIGPLSMTGSLKTPVLEAHLEPGYRYYRLEVDIRAPSVSRGARRIPTVDQQQRFAVSPSVRLFG